MTTTTRPPIETKNVDVVIKDADGQVIFEMLEVEAPKQWRDQDINILAQKYLHPTDSKSLVNMIDRVVYAIATHGLTLGYFDTEEEVDTFANELFDIVLKQKAAWNSPVWFNVGIEDSPQCWACLILSVEDKMHGEHGIKAWIQNEAETFLGGSGVGANLSSIRGDGEPLLNGKGTASGPISFMRWADAGAGSIKSGGRTRRAAKMVMLDADHPDIFEFIGIKAQAERQARVMADAGFDISLNGADAASVPFQNANNSVRVTDGFMRKLREQDDRWLLRDRVGKRPDVHTNVKDIWNAIAEAAWDCADPGVQFDTTINDWNTTPNFARINASNPCSEYMQADDTVCNLGSINLKKFHLGGGQFDLVDLQRTTRLMITSMDILVDMSSYPTPYIGNRTKQLRNLGLGFTNLGALLMSMGLPYNSGKGQSVAGALQAYIQGTAAQVSYDLATKLGPYPAWKDNCDEHTAILKKHYEAVELTPSDDTYGLWLEAENVWASLPWDEVQVMQRNAQLSVIAPTGTISFLMGAETTGIEPVFAINAVKDLVGGGEQDVSVQECVVEGILVLKPEIPKATAREEVDRYLGIYPEVFDTAMEGLTPDDHMEMMAAVQPFVSGAISKTVNMPADATVMDVARTYGKAWELGLKALAIYRDGSKSYQPVNVKGGVTHERAVRSSTGGDVMKSVARRKLPGTRKSATHKFEIAGMDFYLIAGFYEDGSLGEIFLKAAQEGSFVSGMIDSFATAVSLGLQYGVPLTKMAEKFQHRNFEPNGVVISDSSIKMSRSVVDYVFNWLTTDEDSNEEKPITVTTAVKEGPTSELGPCPECSMLTLTWTGNCKRCSNCGYDSGCG